MTKKFLSAILSILMVLSVFGAMPVFANDNETEILGPEAGENTFPEIAEGCNRYFFYMPNDWYNEYATDGPGIYWDNDTSSSDEFPGTPLLPTDTDGVYYYDVPKSVEEFYWTNLLDGGDVITDPIYGMELKAPSYPYDMEESFDLAECNGKIFVVDFACVDFNEYDGRMICYGEWFYYYCNGEYGITPVRGDGEIYTENAFHDSKPEPIVLPYLIGDADNNSEVNVKDATAIQKHLADIQKCDIISGDVDNNGLNIKDATAIQKYIAGIDVDVPINTIGYK